MNPEQVKAYEEMCLRMAAYAAVVAYRHPLKFWLYFLERLTKGNQ